MHIASFPVPFSRPFSNLTTRQTVSLPKLRDAVRDRGLAQPKPSISATAHKSDRRIQALLSSLPGFYLRGDSNRCSGDLLLLQLTYLYYFKFNEALSRFKES